MDKRITFGRLLIKSAKLKDQKILKFIDKPDPIVLGIKQRLALVVIDFLNNINYNKV